MESKERDETPWSETNKKRRRKKEGEGEGARKVIPS